MLSVRLREGRKKARYIASFLRRKLVHINLQLLYDCTFRCQICDFWKQSHADRPRLTVSQVELISHKLARIGPQIVSIGGGEPLLHPDIVRVVRALSRFHFPVMISNGWFVTPANARALFEAGIFEVSVSVDYADPERHDRQRGTSGAFERAVAALRILHANRVWPWQRVHMISVITDDNLDQVESLIRLCRRIGITYLVTLYSDKRGAKRSRPADADVSRHLLRLKSRWPEFVTLRGYMARFTQAVREGGIGHCQAGRTLCNVDSQGDVSLCIDRLDESVGNILTDDVRVIEGRLLEAHRRNTCQGCWTSCRGSIETLMSTRGFAGNLLDYHRMTRFVDLGRPFGSVA